MPTDLDIYRSAHAVINQHGDGAKTHASQMADKMLDKGDADGQAVWLRILRAIDELSDTDAKTVH